MHAAALMCIATLSAAASAEAVSASPPACRASEAAGCYRLGLLYEAGAEGVNKDEARAAESYDLACKSGHAAACSKLGRLYRQGTGVALDEGRAATLFDKGCTNGDLDGCVGLGLMFEDGLGVEQDGSRAAALYEKACSGGAAMGCMNLGSLYLTGQGVARNADRALVLMKRACVGRLDLACETVGQLVPFTVQVGVRGDVDLLTPGLMASLTGQLSRGSFSAAVTAFLRLPPAFRLEGRFHPVELGPIKPYAALGMAFFFSDAALALGGHTAAGVDVQIGPVHLLGEIAYERFINPAPRKMADSILLGLGTGWSF